MLVTVLVALLLPVLNEARELSRERACGSNLRGMMIAWSALMADRQDKIPYVVNQPPPHIPMSEVWTNQLRMMMPGQVSAATVCPNILDRARPVGGLNGPFGYAINGRWTPPGPGGGIPRPDHQTWAHVRRPSQYPWFADFEVVRDTVRRDRMARSWFGELASDSQYYGMGPLHGGETYANVSYADGSVRVFHMDDLLRSVAEEGYAWFENR